MVLFRSFFAMWWYKYDCHFQHVGDSIHTSQRCALGGYRLRSLCVWRTWSHNIDGISRMPNINDGIYVNIILLYETFISCCSVVVYVINRCFAKSLSGCIYATVHVTFRRVRQNEVLPLIKALIRHVSVWIIIILYHLKTSFFGNVFNVNFY